MAASTGSSCDPFLSSSHELIPPEESALGVVVIRSVMSRQESCVDERKTSWPASGQCWSSCTSMTKSSKLGA